MKYSKSKHAKEIKKIIKSIAPQLERLLELTEDPGDVESVLDECIRSGARGLLIARRISREG